MVAPERLRAALEKSSRDVDTDDLAQARCAGSNVHGWIGAVDVDSRAGDIGEAFGDVDANQRTEGSNAASHDSATVLANTAPPPTTLSTTARVA